MQTHVINGQNELNRRRTEAGSAVRQPQSAGDIAAKLPSNRQSSPRVFVEPPPPKRPPPERVTLATLDTSRHPELATAVRMARAWAARKRSGHDDASLVLCGNNGTGKTHIAKAIWWSMTQCAVDEAGNAMPGTERPSGAFYACNDLIGALGSTRDAETGIIVPARAANVIGNRPLIVFDDVGTEQIIPFVAAVDQPGERQARLFKVVDYCYTAQISIIITSNFGIPELAAYIGRRAWDRLLEMAPKLSDGESFMCNLFNVPSYRQEASGR